MAKLDERIGFIGGGNMAFAIGSGLIDRGINLNQNVLEIMFSNNVNLRYN